VDLIANVVGAGSAPAGHLISSSTMRTGPTARRSRCCRSSRSASRSCRSGSRWPCAPARTRPTPALVDRLRLAAGPALLHPAPLSAAAVARLVERDVPGAPARFAAAVAAATRGNPMLVGEVLAEAALHGGREDGPPPALATLVPETLARSVLVALERMGDGARALAAAVAILDEGPLRRAAALAGLQAPDAEATADALAARAILAPGEPVRFEHPVVAAAVLHALTPFERARLHRRAAELLAADDTDGETLAPHLVAARPEGDPWAVGVLRRAARSALGGGEPETAARLLHRALAEPPEATQRGEVLVELARAEAAAGDGAAIDRFEAALERVEDGPHRTAAWHGLSRLLLARADIPGARAAAARGRAELAPGDPGAELLLADELAAGVLDPARAADMAAERARLVEEVRAGRPPTEPTLLAHLVMHLGWGAIDLDRVPALARAAVAADPLVDPHARGFAAAFVAGALNWVDDLEGAASLLDAAVVRAGQLGDPIAEATALAARALTELQAAGARPRRRTESGPGALTASERRVAELAADGATTRHIAVQLSVSPKTVETHLTRAYRKLGVRSRPELPEALASAAPPPV
jgi:DNA-binding CsgD family transcriptional regulator